MSSKLKSQEYGRIILAQDFLDAATILSFDQPQFHYDRMFSLQLAEEQKKPSEGKFAFNEKSMIVLTKIDIISKIKTPYMIDPLEKQVFYEFEKSPEDETKVEIYKVNLNSDPDFNLIATASEMKYCNENKKQIKKMREKAKMKDDEMCRSDLSLEPTKEIKMPAPNHKHCGVCRVNYEDFD